MRANKWSLIITAQWAHRMRRAHGHVWSAGSRRVIEAGCLCSAASRTARTRRCGQRSILGCRGGAVKSLRPSHRREQLFHQGLNLLVCFFLSVAIFQSQQLSLFWWQKKKKSGVNPLISLKKKKNRGLPHRGVPARQGPRPSWSWTQWSLEAGSRAQEGRKAAGTSALVGAAPPDFPNCPHCFQC